ncbi:RNase adapter RapZ [uncultured Hydrogenophaga sp.]|uniref:RNase adapter RapZ n=1 Tax=uncultured Hydrogenophaga sp. TaxID=199683 RepID=UPI00265DC84D|nr:RNase adapter RapZ [uncultured Hydrogenophaga sp.]
MNTTSLHLVLITGMSGSGKSVALAALEDLGFYCVDNLPPELLKPFMALDQNQQARRVAVAMDVRSADSLPGLPGRLQDLRESQDRPVSITSIFLDATTDTLVRRFSETRRAHPLSVARGATGDPQSALIEAIERERELLAELREQSLVLDTSLARPTLLRQQLQDLVGPQARPLTLVFESFAFKRGIPMDADFVFDVRMLPNPHYEPDLKPLTGRDPPVADYLRSRDEVKRMQEQITGFLEAWLPSMVRDHRSYVTVGLGCTGGQHRSVYLAEELARHFQDQWTVRVRHRESDQWPRSSGRR